MPMARIRTEPEDFRVEELPLYPPSGEGEHTFVRVEKRLVTTEEVAKRLARAAGVGSRDVGYAGRKDRLAVATQWLSVPRLDPQRALDLRFEGVRVLEAVMHGHKLRTGQLRGNRFEIAVRGVDDETREAARARFAEIGRVGMANAFGSQRFGRAGQNVEMGARLLRGEIVSKDRRKARFAISALQSAVFNDVLASRPTGIGEFEFGESNRERRPSRSARPAPSSEAVSSSPRVKSHCARRLRSSCVGFASLTSALPGASACGVRGARCGCDRITRECETFRADSGWISSFRRVVMRRC